MTLEITTYQYMPLSLDITKCQYISLHINRHNYRHYLIVESVSFVLRKKTIEIINQGLYLYNALVQENK